MAIDHFDVACEMAKVQRLNHLHDKIISMQEQISTDEYCEDFKGAEYEERFNNLESRIKKIELLLATALSIGD